LPLSAPPFPTNAVMKPVALPPAINVRLFAGNFNSGFTRKDTDVTTGEIPKMSFRIGCGRIPIKNAHTKLKRTLGTPN
jgi:hypothetical protein